MKNIIKSALTGFVITLLASDVYANEVGISGRSGAPGDTTCTSCHGGGSYSYTPSITVNSPAISYFSSYVIENGDTATVNFKLNNGPTTSRAAYAGFNASSPEGTLTNPTSTVKNINHPITNSVF